MRLNVFFTVVKFQIITFLFFCFDSTKIKISGLCKSMSCLWAFIIYLFIFYTVFIICSKECEHQDQTTDCYLFFWKKFQLKEKLFKFTLTACFLWFVFNKLRTHLISHFNFNLTSHKVVLICSFYLFPSVSKLYTSC